MSMFTGVHLSFALSNYRASISVSENGEFRIVYDAKHDDWDELKLNSGNDLLRMPGTVHLRAYDKPLENPKVIGTLNHIAAYEGSDDGVIDPRPECFSIECLVATDILNRIFDAENANLGPIKIGVSVTDGIKYGWAPDGSEMTWQSDDSSVPIDQISFTFERPSLNESNDVPDELHEQEETTDHVKESISMLTQEVQKGLIWVTGLLVLIAGILAFKN